MGDTMTTYARFSASRPVVIGRASARYGLYRRLRARASAWLRTCADYYDAAAMYEELSRLSEAELARRGLDRPNLARDILRACDWDGRAPRD